MNDDLPLNWESTYTIVRQLMTLYPTVPIDTVGLQQLMDWIIALPGFVDDPALANESILQAILREWYEESETI